MFPTIKSEEEQALMQSDKTYRYEVMPTLGQDPQGRMFYKGHSRRRISFLVMNELTKLNTTNLVITDERTSQDGITVDGISEYTSDGLVHLQILETATGIPRMLKIKKMRVTKQPLDRFPFEIGEKGIEVRNIEDILK